MADGYQALHTQTDGAWNTAVGSQALFSTDISAYNTAIGFQALHDNTSGRGNTATGYFSLLHTTEGQYNAAFGTSALQGNLTGNGNTATGTSALASNTTGTQNVAVGSAAMNANIVGSFNTAIGTNADVAQPNLTNATSLGFGAIVDASNKVRIGNSAVTVIEGQVPFTTPSDGRYKFNVCEDVKGLDFVLQLRPSLAVRRRKFDEQMERESGNKGGAPSYAMQASYDAATRIRRSGFIAQEVEKAANATGYDFSGIIKPKTDQDHYSLSYDAFVVPLVKAVQEQQQVIQEQGKKIASLQEQLDEIKKLLQSK